MLHLYQKEILSGSRSSVLLDSLYKYVNKHSKDTRVDRLLDKVKPVLKSYTDRYRQTLLAEKDIGRFDIEEMLNWLDWKNHYFLAVLIHVYKHEYYTPHNDKHIHHKIEMLHYIPLGLPSFYIPHGEQYNLVEDALWGGIPVIKAHAYILSRFDIKELYRLYEIYNSFHQNLWKEGLAEEVVDKMFIELIVKDKRFLDVDYTSMFYQIKGLGERMIILNHVLDVFREFVDEKLQG